MQVAPIPGLDPEINEVRTGTANIVNRYIIPNEERLALATTPTVPGWRSRSRKPSRRPASGRPTCRRNTAAWASAS